MNNHRRTGRAWRRHDAVRLKRARANHFSVQGLEEFSPKVQARILGRALHTAARCSCWMCGNPRRDSKQRLTIPEQNAIRSQHDAEGELG